MCSVFGLIEKPKGAESVAQFFFRFSVSLDLTLTQPFALAVFGLALIRNTPKSDEDF